MELSQYFKIFLKWWWLILLSTGIAAGASYYVTLQQPRVYQASTTLIVGQIIREANPTTQDFYTIERLAQSYAQIAQRQPILQATVESLGLATSWQGLRGRVSVRQIQGTQLLEISVLDDTPERAQLIADELAQQLILQSPTSPENQTRQERDTFVRNQLDSLEARIEAAQSRTIDLEAELANAFSARQIQELQTELSNLQSLITGWQSNYAELLNFLQGGDSPNFLTVIEPAQIPTVSVSPKVQTNVLVAAAVGLVLALGAIVLLEYLDDSIATPHDLTESLNLTLLGSISRSKSRDTADKLIILKDPFSAVSENYRKLRSNIQFMDVELRAKSILITSPIPGEGKSLTTANLAVVMAQADLKTIIVDADLRRPSLHKVFGLSNFEGLTDLLRSPALEIECHLKKTSVDNLYVITSGPLTQNPSEVLGSVQMARLIERLEDMADIILFDSAPVLVVSDSVALANLVDGVILIFYAGRSRHVLARQAVEDLNQVGAKIMGGVLNGVSEVRQYGYYNYQYDHSNGYGPKG